MGLRTRRPTVAMRIGDEEDFDNDYSDKNDYDYICRYDSSRDHGSGDDKSSDDYSCTDDGDDIDNDDCGGGDATDDLCAICDNGGKLLCCEGQCKRSFHPREKDGRESNCETLGLTSAQLQEIDHYLCKNCEFKQHQCFSCGDLEPSDGPNAKVFQCYKASCGHFYHPSCIAKLLEPDDTDGACELEKRITAGMSFTCPAHWCSECRTMEDSSQPNTLFGLRPADAGQCHITKNVSQEAFPLRESVAQVYLPGTWVIELSFTVEGHGFQRFVLHVCFVWVVEL